MRLKAGKLREARERAGLTQRELAERADLTEATVNRLEQGYHAPRVVTVRKLAAILNVEIGDLGDWGESERAGDKTT